ncbi:MAG: hypothetical protein HC849_30225 [Oscillatoriales cyanobacterium RU_3_3]|nr:hypothetical protein [Oscillatoriales cyanobacterium RU_3_3]
MSESNNTLRPLHSAAAPDETVKIEEIYLYPWQVEGICLNAKVAFDFLQSLPLNSTETDYFIGGDLRFWTHIARWSLDLLARCKFLPSLEKQLDGSAIAKWQPLLDSSTDKSRFANFVKQMPAACRTYQQTDLITDIAVDFTTDSQELMLGFLSSITDSQVRSIGSGNAELKMVSPAREWVQALQQESGIVQAEPAALEKLASKLTAWTVPLQNQLSQNNQFRTCFQLIPPAVGKVNWSLNYCLQAADEAEFLVDAKTVWNNPVERLSYAGRTLELPQETLLSGLGLASKLYPLIEPSLQEQRPQSCNLNPLDAYNFIKSVAWRFTDSGLGVVLPPSLTKADGWASRLGLSIQAETKSPLVRGGKEGLGLQSLLNFKWELTIGGQRISQAEFNRLVALNSPLVEINGEWVELRAPDVKAAQTFFASRKEQMTLSLEDALRLASGDTQSIEKLPVVNFEAAGQLQELLNALSDNQAVSAIETPTNFRGQLRPYQALGAGWLAFLERWGLGACLADDMGCGKCILPQNLLFVNGFLQKAEKSGKIVLAK